MKKILTIILYLMATIAVHAGDSQNFLTINAGIQIPNSLDSSIGFEHEMHYGNAIEVFGEAGNHWLHPSCHMFWKGYYWDGGVVYKQPIKRYKNSVLRFRVGAYAGADSRKFFFGAEVGFEYNYVFSNGVQFCFMQKNNFNFLHAARDHFRNGIMLGLRFPI